MSYLKNLWQDEQGIGTVEMILILVDIWEYILSCLLCIKVRYMRGNGDK